MRTLLLIIALWAPINAATKPPPRAIAELRALTPGAPLEHIGDIAGGDGYRATLYAYESAGLTVHAMVATPLTPQPGDGYPILVFNHGYHPDPPRYGFTADGQDWRPGDYYRRIPALYAQHGFIVVIPDYRGHSNSEGSVFTEGLLAASYYAEDVVQLLRRVDDIPDANPERLFMMGHSMGGEVTLRAVMAGVHVRAASLWSTVGGSLWDQAFYYSRYEQPYAMDDSAQEKPGVAALRHQIAALDEPFDVAANNPYRYIDALQTPLILHHSIDDSATAYRWSADLARALYLNDKIYRFYSYPGGAHLFGEEDLALAAERDVRFFSRFDVQ